GFHRLLRVLDLLTAARGAGDAAHGRPRASSTASQERSQESSTPLPPSARQGAGDRPERRQTRTQYRLLRTGFPLLHRLLRPPKAVLEGAEAPFELLAQTLGLAVPGLATQVGQPHPEIALTLVRTGADPVLIGFEQGEGHRAPRPAHQLLAPPGVAAWLRGLGRQGSEGRSAH